MSPPLPFALPAGPAMSPTGHVPVPGGEYDYFGKGAFAHARGAARPALTIAPIPPPVPYAYPYAYSPHRVVDGGTLTDREQQQAAFSYDAPSGEFGSTGASAGMLAAAARAVVRPVSTPPTPLQPDAPSGVARVRTLTAFY